ncbi:unnamed protein product [Owenia fusiformis]|uniref:Uncharacterized protein n=1 Tax=Owenia fusiformis TaxID=6347 RepID=A0A8J1UWI6_OWEFU|nr:unnamed protein product [Owenia fusiformis]
MADRCLTICVIMGIATVIGGVFLTIITPYGYFGGVCLITFGLTPVISGLVIWIRTQKKRRKGRRKGTQKKRANQHSNPTRLTDGPTRISHTPQNESVMEATEKAMKHLSAKSTKNTDLTDKMFQTHRAQQRSLPPPYCDHSTSEQRRYSHEYLKATEKSSRYLSLRFAKDRPTGLTNTGFSSNEAQNLSLPPPYGAPSTYEQRPYLHESVMKAAEKSTTERSTGLLDKGFSNHKAQQISILLPDAARYDATHELDMKPMEIATINPSAGLTEETGLPYKGLSTHEKQQFASPPPYGASCSIGQQGYVTFIKVDYT